MIPRRAIPLAIAMTATALLAGCGDDDDTTTAAEDTPAEVTTSTTETAATETAGETTTSATAAEAEGTLIEVTVTGGEVEGGGRTPVPLGDAVTIRVTSDVDDHIHLHGYDVLTDVTAGEPAELVFTADIPGVFEVELEDARLPLLELEVS